MGNHGESKSFFGRCTQPAFFQQPLAHTLLTHIKGKNIIKTYESLFYCTGLSYDYFGDDEKCV